MKNRYTISKLAAIALLAIFPITFFGQSDDDAKSEKRSSSHSPYWFMIGELGAAWHHGDLAEYGHRPDFEYTKINGRLGLGYQFGGVVGINGKLGRGYLGGQKTGLNQKLDYNDYYDATLNVTFNLMNLFGGYNPDRLFSIIPQVGVGYMQWKSRTTDLTTGEVVRTVGFKDSEEADRGGGINNRLVAGSVPFGGDLNFNVSPKLDLYLNYTFHIVDTDRLDGNERIKGMPIEQDMYGLLNFGARFKFGQDNMKNMVRDFDQVTLQVIPEVLVERGDSVEVTIKGTFPPKYFHRDAVMNFTPVIKYDGGAVAMDPINFKGEKVTGDATLISYNNGGSFTYTSKVPYNPGMNVSELVVEPLIYPFKGTIQPSKEMVLENEAYMRVDQRKLADGVIYTSKRIEDNFAGKFADHQYEKETILTRTANIYFLVNLFNLNWNVPLNRLAANKDLLAAVTADVEKGYAIKDVNIAGWASPEGEETFNQGLSENRAKTAETYMRGKFRDLRRARDSKVAYASSADVMITRTANGPDWNGFMNAVEASDIRDKNAILNVVRSANVAQREQEIRNMILIYPEIEDKILPPLRRSIITVNTYMPKKTDDEIATLSTTNPEGLDVKELLYAATLTDDLNTQKMIYASAMSLHPDSWRAVVNAANVEIQLGNLSEAKSLLNKANGMYDSSAEIHNNLGVVAAMEKDFAAAETHFRKSQQLGGDVSYNMGVVNIFKGDYAQAVNLMRSTTCDYNTGLAQMLNGDNAGAMTTLNCAEESAAGFYLKAIIGARTSDKAAFTQNLMKAIEADGSYKNQARWDREFIKYFNDQDFKNIVQ
jgi:outer membrane protein OmpA-like peptidoglycan-associated protein